MSHIATVNIVIKSIPALKKACEALEMVFKEDQKTFHWYYSSRGDNACVHAISTGELGAYEIGVIRENDHFKLVYDAYTGQRGPEGKAGKGLCKLKKQYGLEAGTEQLLATGHLFESETVHEDGEIERVFVGYM